MRILSVDELPEPARSQARAELEKQGITPGKSAKPGKYRNQRIEVNGETFDSKLEHACYLAQLERIRSGEARWALRQVSFPLPGNVRYRCDFLVHLVAGGVDVIDAKGVLTKEFVIKAKQMLDCYGIEILIWTRKGTTPFRQFKPRR